MRCKNCNYDYDNKSEFCPNCGFKIDKAEKKESNNFIIILIIVLILVAAVSVTLFLVFKNINTNKNNPDKGNGTQELNNNTKATKKKNEIGGYEYYEMDIDADNIKIVYDGDLGKNIKVDKVIYDEHGLHVLATNNNDIPVDPNIDLYFLDKDGKRVDKGLSSAMQVDSKKQFATDVYSTSKKDFSSYELHVSANKIKSYEHMFNLDKTELDVSETENSIKVKYNNNHEYKVSLYVTVIYYKNNNIHYFDDLYLTINPGEEYSYDSYYSYLPAGKYDEKDFDKYEIIVSGARYNDSTY